MDLNNVMEVTYQSVIELTCNRPYGDPPPGMPRDLIDTISALS